MRTLISMLIVAAAVVSLWPTAPAASAREYPEPTMPYVPGGFALISVSNPHIQELGRWAVLEHVKQTSDGLVFSKVVSAQEQVVTGVNYKLVIQATKSGAGKSAMYRAVVYEKFDMTRHLLSFDPAN